GRTRRGSAASAGGFPAPRVSLAVATGFILCPPARVIMVVLLRGESRSSGETAPTTASRAAEGRGPPRSREADRRPAGGPLLPEPLFRGDVEPGIPGRLPAPERAGRRDLRASIPSRRRGSGGPDAPRPPPHELRVRHRPRPLPRPRLLGLVRERLPARPAHAAPGRGAAARRRTRARRPGGGARRGGHVPQPGAARALRRPRRGGR